MLERLRRFWRWHIARSPIKTVKLVRDSGDFPEGTELEIEAWDREEVDIHSKDLYNRS